MYRQKNKGHTILGPDNSVSEDREVEESLMCSNNWEQVLLERNIYMAKWHQMRLAE